MILFVSMFGLFVVIDGFSNVDEFQEHSKTTLDLLGRMASYYGYQSTLFLDMCGPILTVIDAMIVFALLLRNSELHPVLAAGVPTWRLLVPVIISTAFINGVCRQPGIGDSADRGRPATATRLPDEGGDRNRTVDGSLERYPYRRAGTLPQPAADQKRGIRPSAPILPRK